MEKPPKHIHYKKLRLWKSAEALSALIQDLSHQAPLRFRANLADQMRRAALSIPSNIAEGVGRGTNRDCLKFLFIAQGSLRELESQFDSAVFAELISERNVKDGRDLLRSTKRDLGGLIYVRCKRLKEGELRSRRTSKSPSNCPGDIQRPERPRLQPPQAGGDSSGD